MANFKRHIQISAIGTGLISTSLLGAGYVSSKESVLLWFAGSFAGILPDIDSDNSTTLDIIFALLTLVSIMLTLPLAKNNLSILEIWVLIIAIIIVMNWIIRPIFESYTVHRGIFHSLLSGAVFSSLSVVFAYHSALFSSFFSWVLGLLVFTGYCIHLILDEVYSVDFMNVRVKRSFGTALKLFEYKSITNSLIMLLVLFALQAFSPSMDRFERRVLSIQTYQDIRNSFFPKYLGS